jgi:hypothetical protein
MQKITRSDIRGLPIYEQIRDELRKKVIEIKRPRRVAVGPQITFVFENRATMIFQIEEMIRTENIRDEKGIQHEIDTFNQLLPDVGELSATMFLEFTALDQIREELSKLVGIEQATFLEIGGERILADFAAGQSDGHRLSAVQYVRFRLSPVQIARFRDETTPVALVIEHPAYRARTELSAETRASLARDLD